MAGTLEAKGSVYTVGELRGPAHSALEDLVEAVGASGDEPEVRGLSSIQLCII